VSKKYFFQSSEFSVAHNRPLTNAEGRIRTRICHCSRRRMSCRKWASACQASTSLGCSDRCSGSMCPTGTRIHPLLATASGWRGIQTRRSTEAGAPSAPRPPPCRPSRRLPIDSRPQVGQRSYL